ncbi:alpha/beta fold hydrolase [Thermodesulfobacteriota bacterium]
MNPLYFGDSERPLFGIYHPPESKVFRDVGVLLCYPAAQEYMSTHWAFRRLSKLLSQAGFHVFRFDYLGTGDSSGESREGNVAQWKADICSAFDELKHISGAREVSIVGVRFGATLATQASAEGLGIKDLVLWDPVIVGKEYVRELEALHHDFIPDLQVNSKDNDFDEILGYPFPSELRVGIEQINLLTPPHSTAKRTFLIVSEEKREYFQLKTQLTDTGTQFEYRLVQDSGDWGKPEDFDQALLVNDILHKIRDVLTGERK